MEKGRKKRDGNRGRKSDPVPVVREESHIQGLKSGSIWLQHLVKGKDPGD